MKSIALTMLAVMFLITACKKDNTDYLIIKGTAKNYDTNNPVPNTGITVYNLDLAGAYDEIVGRGKSNEQGYYEIKIDFDKVKANYFEYIPRYKK